MYIEVEEKQLNNQKEFRDFVNRKIVPYADNWDLEEKIPIDMVSSLAKSGYLTPMLSPEYGGKHMDMVTIGLLNEEIGRGCSSIRSLLTVHGMVALAIERFGTYEQKKHWLPKMASGDMIGAFGLTEPEAGTDIQALQTKAVIKGDYYILSGTKKWITFGQIADLFLIFAQLEGSTTAFLVPRNLPGIRVTPIKSVLGTTASMLAEITLEEVSIPRENILGQKGVGVSFVATSCLDYGRYTIAWGCVGIGQACLDACLNYTNRRQTFGKYLKENQMIQQMVTDMITKIKAARLLCMQAGDLKDKGHPNAIMETWIAKYFASTMISQITNDAVQIHGANGCSRNYSVSRYLRDAKVMEIIEGSTQMHQIIIANHAYQMAEYDF
ncbi:acyl-CoA dehydrogenase family protein [Bacillus cereus group sp. N34]|uniref:acyl-CoA dehydrogenase family protein n=1 Tax=Bacillus cereus group sp. N34 TaxID=2794595 RepID=UPI0018F5FF85|nr:acyl-CoA dehydrogenase family protein [Bacillus cereus group sp. N34]MBJ8015080.1 acyl-CoA dehydrogenase family protein [Bacillus cereus group sp. N34]